LNFLVFKNISAVPCSPWYDAALISNHERRLLLLHAGCIQPIGRTLLDVLSNDPTAAGGTGGVMALGWLGDHAAFGAASDRTRL